MRDLGLHTEIVAGLVEVSMRMKGTRARGEQDMIVLFYSGMREFGAEAKGEERDSFWPDGASTVSCSWSAFEVLSERRREEEGVFAAVEKENEKVFDADRTSLTSNNQSGQQGSSQLNSIRSLRPLDAIRHTVRQLRPATLSAIRTRGTSE